MDLKQILEMNSYKINKDVVDNIYTRQYENVYVRVLLLYGHVNVFMKDSERKVDIKLPLTESVVKDINYFLKFYSLKLEGDGLGFN